MSIDLIGPDGQQYVLDNDDPAALNEALRQGFKQPVAPVEKSALEEAGEAVAAGTLGAAQGLTGGLLGVALGKNAANRPAAKEALRLEEENPIASGVGEMAGMVASPLNAIGTAVEGARAATVAGRIGQKALGGAPIGALYGAGKTLSDAALGDVELTADKVIASAGLGALLGFAGSGVGSAIEEGASAVLPKVGKAIFGAQKTLDDIANDAAVKATRATQAEIKEIGEANVSELGQAIREMNAIGSPAEMGTAIGQRRTQLANDLLKGLDVDTQFAHTAGAEEVRMALGAAKQRATEAMSAEREAAAKSVLKQLGVEADLPHNLTRDEAQEAIAKALDSYGKRQGDALSKIDATSVDLFPAYSSIRTKITDWQAALNPAERDIVDSTVKRTLGYLDEMGSKKVGSKENGFAALNDLKTTLQKNINYKAESGAKNGLDRQLVGLIRSEIDNQIEAGAGAALSKEFIESKRVASVLHRGEEALGRKTSTAADAIEEMAASVGHASPELEAFRRLGKIKDIAASGGPSAAERRLAMLTAAEESVGRSSATGADAISAMLKRAGVSPKEARLFEVLGHGERLNAKGAGRTGSMSLGLKDLLAGGLGGAIHPAGIATAVASKYMREHGPALVAKAADAIAKSPQLSSIAASFSKQVGGITPKLGPYGAQLSDAFARGPAIGLATHMALAQVDPGYAATAELAGLTPEGPEEHDASLARAHGLASINAVSQRSDEEISKYVDKILKGSTSAPTPSGVFARQDFGTKRMRRDSLDAHDKRMEEIQQLAANPDALLDRLAKNTEAVGPVAPGLTAALSARANAAVQYLAKVAERPVPAGPLAPKWVSTQAQRHDFSVKLQVVEDPMSVMKHAAAGSLTGTQVEALKTVYPTLWKQMSDTALERAMGRKSLPYRSKMMLSILTGVDVDGSMSQGAISRNQQAIYATKQKNQEHAESQSGARSEMTLASRLATPTQRREMETS